MSENLIGDVNKKVDSRGRTTLHLAAKSNDILLVKKLLSQKANVNALDNFGATPLHLVAFENIDESHLQVIEVLLKNGADPNIRHKFEQMPFWYIVRKGNLKVVKLFLSFKADINMSVQADNLLCQAAENNKNPEVLQLFIDRGLKVDRRSNKSWTPLHAAAHKNENESHYEVIEILLKNGADPNARGCKDITPFYYLVKKGSIRIVRLFLSFKADANVFCDHNHNLLFAAIENNKNLEVLQLLIDLGLNVNHPDSTCVRTALYHAAEKNKDESHLKVIEMLLKNKADANALDIFGETPLFSLVKRSNARTVKLFLNFNIDVETENNDKESALFTAVKFNDNTEVIQMLIDHGSDVNLQDSIEMTPLRYALSPDYLRLKTIKCLLRNGSILNEDYQRNLTPVAEAIIEYIVNEEPESEESIIDNKVFNFLLKHIDFNILDRRNDTILSFYYGTKPGFVEQHLWMMIIQHIAKLQSLNISIHQSYLDEISKTKEYNCYYDQCQKELLLAKDSKLQNSWITFYNLLVDNSKKLKNYAGNFVEDFELSDWNDKFPIYGSRLDKNVKKGIKRRKLFDESSIALSGCLPIFMPNHLIIYDILNCILSEKDLSKLCE